jgi:hypothetical protein
MFVKIHVVKGMNMMTVFIQDMNPYSLAGSLKNVQPGRFYETCQIVYKVAQLQVPIRSFIHQ